MEIEGKGVSLAQLVMLLVAPIKVI